MRHNKACTAYHEFIERSLNVFFTFGIQRTRCFIQKQNRRVFQQCACNGNSLTLTARELRAALTHPGIKSFRKRFNKGQQIGRFSRFADIFIGHLVANTVGDIGGDRVIEKHHVLAHKRNLRAQAL